MDEFWVDRPTLVTGATGLLGGWLVRSLIRARADLVCLVRDWSPNSEFVRGRLMEKARVVWGDVRDQTLMERALGEYEIDTVFHLAAQTIVPISNRNPASTFESNVGGTWSVLEACRRSPTVRQIVVASSDKAYGDQAVLPYVESMPLEARYPYDVSKACADLIARSYSSSFQLPIAIARCGNLYGGGDLNWNRLVPGTIRSIFRTQPPIIRSSGALIRDYIYVEDAVAAYALLAERLCERRNLSGEAFNFSNESHHSSLEIAKRILALMHSNLEPVIKNEAKNEIVEQYLSSQKAREFLGWLPVFSLDAGLERTIEWYKGYLANDD